MAEPVNKILELRREKARLVNEMRSILDTAEAEKRVPTAEEREVYDRLEKDVDLLGERITLQETQRERELELEGLDTREFDPRETQGENRGDAGDADEKRYAEVFAKYLRSGTDELEREERSILSAGWREARDQSKGTNSAGGYLVPTSFERELYVHLVQAGAVRQTRVRVITTTSGEALLLPKTSSHGTASLLSEGSAASASDEAFDQLQLDSWTYVRLVKMSFQLEEDEAVGLPAYLQSEIGRSIGALQNSHFVTGSGSSRPNGIVTAASVGKTGATGQTTTIVYDDVVDLVHSIGVPYRRNGEFLAADGLIKALRKLKDADGLPIWQTSMQAGEPDTLLGYPIYNDPDLAAPAAAAKTLIFGDFSAYVIRDVRGVAIRRLDERFADSLQVAYLGWMRTDGDLLDTGALKVYQHAAS